MAFMHTSILPNVSVTSNADASRRTSSPCNFATSITFCSGVYSLFSTCCKWFVISRNGLTLLLFGAAPALCDDDASGNDGELSFAIGGVEMQRSERETSPKGDPPSTGALLLGKKGIDIAPKGEEESVSVEAVLSTEELLPVNEKESEEAKRAVGSNDTEEERVTLLSIGTLSSVGVLNGLGLSFVANGDPPTLPKGLRAPKGDSPEEEKGEFPPAGDTAPKGLSYPRDASGNPNGPSVLPEAAANGEPPSLLNGLVETSESVEENWELPNLGDWSSKGFSD